MQSPDQERTGTDIAIIGMAGRFPGARSVDEYWRNLLAGVESIRRLSDEELLAANVSRREFEQPDYVRACPVLEGVDQFDAAFFGISPRDASVMDPAHRLFLEVAWQALEHSGNTGLPTEGRVGVFAGSGAPLYWMKNVRSHRELCEAMGEFLVRHTANDMNFLATRVSYDLDLRGPSINVQTACSSALVAVHLARQSLLARECDMALIGGATVVLPMGQGYHYKEGEILSPDGHCRPFDHKSAGTVFGSGAAVVVLKRLEDALDNGDSIIAVIKGSAVNNDGAVKVGYLAPSVDGQAEVIKKALAVAGTPARSIGYVEAHGTGTSVGDPIELAALEQAYRQETADTQFCGVGSVKSNIGHLGEAAGVAGLIKLALALRHRVIPPTLNYERPNPRFALLESPFYVVDRKLEWRADGPLRAGITGLGAGGTNCHLVLEEPPAPLPGEGGRSRQVLVLSARTRTALDRMSLDLANLLERQPETDLADAAYTLAMGRRELGHRRAIVARDNGEAIALLRGADPARVATIAADPDDPAVVFSFPGGGAQYARMCFDLYESEPVYREALDQCLRVIDRFCDPAVRGLLFAAPEEVEAATIRLQRPSLALPALFAVEYALARLYESFGLRPFALLGHSMGEYVAACLAGVFSLQDGLRLVHTRGKLFERTTRGRMVSLSSSESVARGLLAGLSIAAVNAPELCVASGAGDRIEKLCAELTAREIDFTPIHIDVAAHSSLLDPILAEFRAFCGTIALNPPTIPIASNLTGRWLTAAEATDPEYWVQHLRGTVRFADCVETIVGSRKCTFLEIGPGRTLTTLVGMQATKIPHAYNSVRHPRESADDVEYALLSLGRVWGSGAKCDWTALYDGQLRNRIPLTGYPFEGRSYWLEERPTTGPVEGEPHKRDSVDDWFATVSFDLQPQAAARTTPERSWLVVADDSDLARMLSDRLRARLPADSRVVLAVHGEIQRRNADGTFEVVRGATDQYRTLLEQLQHDGVAVEHVVLVVENGSGEVDDEQQRSYWAPTHLAQAMATVLDAAGLTLVTRNAFAVAGEALDPFARLAVGPALVIPRELPDFRVRLVDLDARSATLSEQIEQLTRELLVADPAPVVALRAPRRWVPQLRPTRLPAADGSLSWLRDDAVVFVTGGLGGMGRVLSQHLCSRRRLRLALLTREKLPPRSEWDRLRAHPDTAPRVRDRLDWLVALEAAGSRAIVVQGDVADRSSLDRALAEVRAQFGAIDVVIHAAGLMDDHPLQSKSDASMRRVMAPKVLGTLNLDAAVTEDVAAFVMMSSIASLLGLPGQIDYTAANAFLDAFAEARSRRRSGRTIAINWNAWRDVGMIVEGGARGGSTALPPGRCRHPWLQAWQPTENGRLFAAGFSTASHWLLAEHRIVGGAALIPGTGFVELARAAFVETWAPTPTTRDANAIELRNVTFLSPFQVPAGETRMLQADVRRAGDGCTVTLTSDDGQHTHMTAEVAAVHATQATADLAALWARCPREVPTRDGFLDQDFVAFGPRWRNLGRVARGTAEAVLALELGAEFTSDLPTFAYHPALLDMATGGAQWLIPGFEQRRDFLVPFGYDRITIRGAVAGRCTSHVRVRPESSIEVAAFDVDVYDEHGVRLIEVQGFTMKRVDASAAITQGAGAAARATNPATEALLRDAITPAEGVVAFERALQQTEAMQVVASSVDVETWRRKLAREAEKLKGGDDGGESPTFSRPALASAYEAPGTPLERQLAAMWAKLLGVDEIGVHDNFFELGGNSLIAVRFFTRVKKDFGVNLPLSTLFQRPTIRQLAEGLIEQGYRPAAEVKEPAGPSEALPRMVAVPAAERNGSVASSVAPPMLIRAGSGSQPLFLVHDGLGEVLLYRSLAMLLDPVLPVYGLEPETANGRVLHTSVAAMAAAKAERIRHVQPHGPYLLAGLCAGGVIAYETARLLEDAGEEVLFVGLIDAAAVGAEERSMRIAKGRWQSVRAALAVPAGGSRLRHLLGIPPVLARKARNVIAYTIQSRLERRRVARAMEKQRAGGADVTATAEIPFLKVYENAHRQHQNSGRLRCADVVLFRATEGNGEIGDVPFREVYADELLGWRPLCAQPVQAVDVPGGHSSALQEPHVGTLALEMTLRLRPLLAELGGRGRMQSPSANGSHVATPRPDAAVGASPREAGREKQKPE